MSRSRSIRIALAAVVVAASVLAAGTALAGWRGLNDLNYDDRGRVCRDGMEFALANLGPSVASVTVLETDAGGTNVIRTIVPTTPLAQLVFNPVPELSSQFADYNYSGIFQLRFPVTLAPGTYLSVEFSGGSGVNGGTVDQVTDCKLDPGFLGFPGPVGEPPNVNASVPGEVVPVRFLAAGVTSPADVVVSVSSIPCSAGDPPLDEDTVPAVGQLRRFGAGVAFAFAWQTDPAWTGCKQLSFRTPLDGLVHRLNFNFG
ncbi:MAG TPA: hypothetical protein VFR43_00020 [Gaiellaceae bacterium]|nr:hypothetical protein [Gaiellaceae bacterium]